MRTFETVSVPFSTWDDGSGLHEINGVVRVEAAGLVVEGKVETMGIPRKGIRVARIPFREVAEARYEKRLFTARIRIRTHSLAPLEDLPGLGGPELLLSVARADRASAQRLVNELNLARLGEFETAAEPPG